MSRPVPPTPLWLLSDARLADLGALLVFRHWLRCQLQELAGLQEGDLYPFRPGPETEDRIYSRLFF